MANMQIPIWFWRKTSNNLFLTVLDVLINDRFNKIRGNHIVFLTHKAPPLFKIDIYVYYSRIHCAASIVHRQHIEKTGHDPSIVTGHQHSINIFQTIHISSVP